jgi:site-specific DNA recombinase
MTRAAVYARYSSEAQRDASIEDQVRSCEAYVRNESLILVGTYTDHAISGAVRMRPGYQKLLEDARNGLFDVVVAESLDRLSRDQEDVAALYKHLSFSGVALVTLAEGHISELHIGLKGTMNAIFLKDLGQKVHRGLEGRVRQGKSGGGLCFGYEVVREYDGRGEPIHGGRRILKAEAEIVLQIFRAFATGRSPRAIALALNAAGVPGPNHKSWGPSTIYGNWRRGTGILNNELYVGRLVWNRQRFVKDPVSRRRQARPNPPEAWIVQEVPELRIVDDELWSQVKERQKHIRSELTCDSPGIRAERARRPAYLLSNLLKCGVCQGGFSMISASHYGCSNARNRGTCNNRLTMRRDVLEASVLSGLRTHLMQPELVREFIAEYHRLLNHAHAQREAAFAQRKHNLVRVERQIVALIEAIKDGLRTPAMKQELLDLEARKLALESDIGNAAPPPIPRLHPRLADLYQEKVANLHAELNRPEMRAEAAEILRGLIEAIRLTPGEDGLEIELIGDLAALLSFAQGSKKPASGGDGLMQVTLVAGPRNPSTVHELRQILGLTRPGTPSPSSHIRHTPTPRETPLEQARWTLPPLPLPKPPIPP